MLTRGVRARLADDVQLWLTDGLITPELAAKLRERYQASRFGLVGVVKYLGIAGALFSLFGILGLVAALSRSEVFAGGLLLAVGAGLMAAGLWLARDVRNRYAVSSRAVTTVGAIAAASALGVLADALGVKHADLGFVIGLFAVPVFIGLAYRMRDGFLLVLASLAAMHWVGSWTQMWGHSTYVTEIDQPRVMIVAALALFAVGFWHEQHQTRFGRFHLVYEAVGLTYLNLSLLVLGIVAHPPLPWVLALTGAALVQIVAGARLHNGLVLGFGVTAAAVDLFTRYFEQFWDKLSLGSFLALGGSVLLASGLAFERARRGRTA